MKYRGYIKPYWDRASVDALPFVTPPDPHIGFELTDPKDLERYGKLITADRITELPSILDNPALEQEFDWLENKIYAVHRMNPGTLLPSHRDLYRYYKKSNNITDINDIIRVIVFLDNWHSGQILEIKDQLITKWLCGEWYAWRGGDAHLAANLGHDFRYTFQITGTLK